MRTLTLTPAFVFVLVLLAPGCARELNDRPGTPSQTEHDPGFIVGPGQSDDDLDPSSPGSTTADPDSGLDLDDPELDLSVNGGAALVLVGDGVGETILLIDESGIVQSERVALPPGQARRLLVDGPEVYVISSANQLLHVGSGDVVPWQIPIASVGVTGPGEAVVASEYVAHEVDLATGTVQVTTENDAICWVGAGYSADGGFIGFDMLSGLVRSLSPESHGETIGAVTADGPVSLAVDTSGALWSARYRLVSRVGDNSSETWETDADVWGMVPFGDTVAVLLGATYGSRPAKLLLLRDEEQVVLAEFGDVVALDVEPVLF